MSDERLSGYEVAKNYMAIKLHFSENNYSVLKYGYDFKLSEITFRLWKDRFTFERIARSVTSIYQFRFICSKLHFEKEYVRSKDILSFLQPNNHKAFNFYKALQESDLTMVRDAILEHKLTRENLLEKFLHGEISGEIAAILLDFWAIQISPQYSVVRKMVLLPKYADCLAYDKANLAKLLKSCLNESAY